MPIIRVICAIAVVGVSAGATLADSIPTFGAQPAVAGVSKHDTVFSPPPGYPYEARKKELEGSGVFILHIDPATGAVSSVTVEKSTGVPMLDRAAKDGLGKWKFKLPLNFKGNKIRCPITYISPEHLKGILKRKHS